jgi:hypothetical protein
VKAKEDHGQVIAKKGSWDIKVKLADQVCDMKRIIFAMGSCDNSDQRSFIATEVSTNGFDNLSPAQMIQSLAIDQLSLNRQGDPIPPDCVMSGSCNALGLSKDSQDENISLGARPVSNDPLPFGNGEPDTRGFKEMTASASKRPELEVPCRSSTMSRPNSSDDLFGTIDNQDRAHGQLKHSILALTNESLSCSPLVWSCTVSQNTETSSDIVLTPTDSSTPFDSATSSTSVASSSVSDSQGSSESGETYSTSNSSNYSTDNLLRDLFSEPTVTEYKRELVDRLMRDLCSTICISELVRSLPVNDGSSNSDSNATSHRSSSSVPKSGETKTKGRNDNKKQKKDGNEDGNSDEENGGRQNSTDFLLEGHQKRRLGCPYFLRSPWKYSTRRTCSGPGWHNARHVR